MRVARAALAGGDVILEIAESFRHLFDGADRSLGERGASEICVENHAGRIDDATQGWLSGDANRRGNGIDPLILGPFGASRAARCFNGFSYRVENNPPRMLLQKQSYTRCFEQRAHTRQVTPRVSHFLGGGVAGAADGFGGGGGAGTVYTRSLSPDRPNKPRITLARTRQAPLGLSGRGGLLR